MKIDAEIRRISELLKRKIAGAGTSQKAVERTLGWGDGYISQILAGKVTLKFRHVFSILDVIGISPAEFFGELYGPAGGSDGIGVRPVGRTVPRDELRREVEAVVREILAREG